MRKVRVKQVAGVAIGLIIAMAAVTVQADEKKEGKKAEVIVYRVSADDIAKEFKEDAEKARKKYSPNPPKPGVKGGAIIEIDGAVAHRDGNDFYLQNAAGLKVHIKAKKISGKNTNAVKGTGGKFQSFRRDTILIVCDEVKFVPFAGK